MHLYFFLVVIVSLSCGSLPDGDISLDHAAAASGLLVAAWILLSHVAARMTAIQVRKDALSIPYASVSPLRQNHCTKNCDQNKNRRHFER